MAQTIPVFLAYREFDGLTHAELLYSQLREQPLPALSPTGAIDDAPKLDVFFDKMSPPGKEFPEVNQPKLAKAQALILVVTAGTAARLQGRDWLYKEIDWWLANRPEAAPLLVDTTGEKLRWAPNAITARWNNLQTVDFSLEDQHDKNRISVSLILAAIVASRGARINKDLIRERKRRRILQYALAAVVLLLGLSAWAGFLAYSQREAARRANGDLTTAQGVTKTALGRAEAEAARLRQERSRQLVVKAWNLYEEGDPTGTLLLMGKALALSKGDPIDEPLNRMRFHALRRKYPLEQFWLGARFAAFSPSGSEIVTADSIGGVSLWDASSRRLLIEFDGHDGTVIHACFDRTGGKILTAGADATAVVWDAKTGKRLRTLRHHAPVIRAWFTSDSAAVTATADGTITLFDTETGNAKSKSPKLGGFLAFSRDLATVAVATDEHTVKLHAVGLWGEIGRPKEHRLPVLGASFGPSGRLVTYSGTIVTQPVNLPLELQPGDPAIPARVPAAPLPSSPARKLEGEAQVWEAVTGEPVSRPILHGSAVIHAELAPDGQRIVTCDGATRVWDAKGKQVGDTIKSGSYDYYATFSPDGLYLLTAGSPLDSPTSDSSSSQRPVSSTTPGTPPSSAGDEVRVWDVRSGNAVAASLRHPSRVEFASFGLRNGLLLGGGSGGVSSVSLWDFRLLTSPGSESHLLPGARDAIFRGESDRLIAWSDDRQLLWDLKSGDRSEHAAMKPASIQVVTSRHVAEEQAYQSRRLDILGREVVDTQIFTVIRPVYETTARMCPENLVERFRERERERNLDPAQLGRLQLPGKVFPMGYLNGKYVLTAEYRGSENTSIPWAARIRIWDVATNLPITPVIVLKQSLLRATFSQDGRLVSIVTGQPPQYIPDLRSVGPMPPNGATPKPGGDLEGPPPHALGPAYEATRPTHQEVRIWEVATGQPLTPPYVVDSDVEDFSADGRYHMVVSSREVRVRDLRPGQAGTPIDESVTLAKIVSARDLDPGGELVAVDYDGAEAELAAQRIEFAADLAGPEALAWHRAEASWSARIASHRRNSKLWKAALVHATAWSKAEPTAPVPWAILGEIAAREGRFSDAEPFFATAVAAGSDDVEDWSDLALLRLARGDLPGYRDLCNQAFGRFKGGDSAHAADELAWMSTLAPGPQFSAERHLPLAEWACKEHPGEVVHQNTKIAVLLRAGESAKAFEVEKARRYPGLPGHDPVVVPLWVAHFKESKTSEEKNAIAWELRAIRQPLNPREVSPNPWRAYLTSSWRDNLERTVLLKEAESVVGDLDKATAPVVPAFTPSAPPPIPARGAAQGVPPVVPAAMPPAPPG
jgi:WD40 repeat protein